MGKQWQIQEAKNKLSELIAEAERKGPQVVTRRGKRTAVVMSIEDYQKLGRAEGSLVELLRRSPLAGVDLDVERSGDLPREVDL